MRISLFGLGYIGTVSIACLARLGHHVVGLDSDPAKSAQVGRGEPPPIHEPGLPELWAEGWAAGRVGISEDALAAVAESDLSFVCVGTPSLPGGGVDDGQLRQVVATLAEGVVAKGRRHLIVVRSTALPQVHHALMALLQARGLVIGRDVGYVVHPEFLREGSGIEDFFNPALLIHGGADAVDRTLLDQLYPGLAPAHYVAWEAAALVKYADNLFHATKITFANEIGQLAHGLGVDGRAVMGLVARNLRLNLSAAYLNPGLPFGGSCLPKDLRAILDHAEHSALTLPLLSGIASSNQHQLAQLLDRLAQLGYRRLLLIGLAFKEGTDDLRESPLVQLAQGLLTQGVELHILAPELRYRSAVAPADPLLPAALNGCLVSDLAATLPQVEAVVIGRTLTPEMQRLLEASGRPLIDLVGAPLADGVGETCGLYW